MGLLRVNQRVMSIPMRTKTFPFLNGGLNTRTQDMTVKQNPASRLETPYARNVSYQALNGFEKRKGKVQQGDDVVAPNEISQNVKTTKHTVAVNSSIPAWAQKITVGSSVDLPGVNVEIAAESTGTITCEIRIYGDSGGSINFSDFKAGTNPFTIPSGDTPVSYSKSFIASAALSAGDYWITITYVVPFGYTVSNIYINGDSSGSDMYSSEDAAATLDSVANAVAYYVMGENDGTATSQGLHDYQLSDGTQNVSAVVGGSLYYKDGSSWTEIDQTQASGQDVICDFKTHNDLMFICDYANGNNRVWDGTEQATANQSLMDHGYRAAFTIGESASGGSLSDTTGTGYKIMAVTNLKSGGYRSSVSDRQTITGGGASQKITLTSIGMDAVYGEFLFDIDALATTWFMTEDGGDVYYKIPTANMGGSNPAANNTTSLDITSVANLTSENTPEQEFIVTTEYLTGQVDTPDAKFLETGGGFLFLGGDPNNKSRVWVSAQNQPQVFGDGTSSGADGDFVDVGKDDGQEVEALFWADGYLFVYKTHSIHRLEYNSAGSRWDQRLVDPSVGSLSHWLVQKTPLGVITLSHRGPILHDAAGMRPLDIGKIGNYFDPNSPDKFNLGAMKYATSVHYNTKQEVWFSVSSTSATTRDLTLIYNYEVGAWTLYEGISANVFSSVADSNGFLEPWSGDYSGRVYKHDTGTNDDGSAISMILDTPDVILDDPYADKSLHFLEMSGAVQASGTLYVDIFLDQASSPSYTVSFDMTDARFKNRMKVALRGICKRAKFRFRNSELDVDVKVEAFSLSYKILGRR